MITGGLFFREAGRHPNGKRLMMVVGVIAVDDTTPLKGEHQYVVAGNHALTPNLLEHHNVDLRVYTDTAQDRTEECRGWGLGSLVMQPWWRI